MLYLFKMGYWDWHLIADFWVSLIRNENNIKYIFPWLYFHLISSFNCFLKRLFFTLLLDDNAKQRRAKQKQGNVSQGRDNINFAILLGKQEALFLCVRDFIFFQTISFKQLCVFHLRFRRKQRFLQKTYPQNPQKYFR